nr:hypothetical protein BaRGS_019100 [Batillaria attramentaria]
MMLHAENVRQTRAEKNWERLTIRLLQMENEMLQQEIRKHQQRYIENRSRFMDESAAQARSKPPRDTVQVADVKLRELFVDSTNPPLAGDGTAEVDACRSSVETPSGEQAETEKFVLPEETVEDILAAANPPKPPISIHMKSNLKRPEGVDRLTDDLRRMENMEMIFQRDTKALQRRIGLPEDGIV